MLFDKIPILEKTQLLFEHQIRLIGMKMITMHSNFLQILNCASILSVRRNYLRNLWIIQKAKINLRCFWSKIIYCDKMINFYRINYFVILWHDEWSTKAQSGNC